MYFQNNKTRCVFSLKAEMDTVCNAFCLVCARLLVQLDDPSA
jgi:hypothetical protein